MADRIAIKKKDIETMVHKDLPLATLVSKITKDEQEEGQDNHNRYKSIFTEGSVIKSDTKSYQATQDYLGLFKDQELACEIMIALILSPKNATDIDLRYSLKSTILTNTMVGKIVNLVKEAMEEKYNLSDGLHKMLREIKYGRGSVGKAVLPESVIDEFINTGTIQAAQEAMHHIMDDNGISKTMGLLGTDEPVTIMTGMESFGKKAGTGTTAGKFYAKDSDTIMIDASIGVDITDNYNLLLAPDIVDMNQRLTVESLVNPLFRLNDIGKTADYKEAPTAILPTAADVTRSTIGPATVIDLDVRSCSVVHVPGKPNKHVGYVVALDESGYPITVDSKILKKATKRGSDLFKKNSIGEVLLTKAKKGVEQANKKLNNYREAVEWYTNSILSTIERRLLNGAYGRDLTVSENGDMFTVLFAKAASRKNIRLLYLPAELVSYFALEYNDEGRGVNSLEKLNLINSMRSTLLYSTIAAQVHNNIPQLEVKIAFDPREPDVDKASNVALAEILKLRQFGLPLGLHSPTDQIDWLHRASIRIAYEEHPNLPGTRFEFNDVSQERTIEVDSELATDLRKQAIMGIGPTPEIVDDGFESDFASTAESKKVLLGKRVRGDQVEFAKQLTEHVHRLVLADGELIEEITEIISQKTITQSMDKVQKEMYKSDKEMYIRSLLISSVRSIVIAFPSPDDTSFESIVEEFTTYADSIEDALEYIVSEDLLAAELAGEAGDYADMVMAGAKAKLMRDWMAKHNFLPELMDLMSSTVDGKTTDHLSTELSEHIKILIENTSAYVKKTKRGRIKSDKVISKATDGEEEEDTPPAEGDGEGDATPPAEGDGEGDATPPAEDDPFAI